MAGNNDSLLTTEISIKPESANDFSNWQALFNATITQFPGFVSLEILSPIASSSSAWLVVQRFQTAEQLINWQKSPGRKKLLEALDPFLTGSREDSIKECFSDASNPQGAVTEAIITYVLPENEKFYHAWIAKIHQAEAKFPGFKGVYTQTPNPRGGLHWITFLQFDSQENLDHWLNSPVRKELLDEAKELIHSLENQRVISPFAGWFSSLAKTGALPPVWKQTMIVLLILFPIVMVELKYLPLFIGGLNSSLRTFIGNAISVTLISWPFMPLAIKWLGWWLAPQPPNNFKATFLGTLLIFVFYFLEIIILWRFL